MRLLVEWWCKVAQKIFKKPDQNEIHIFEFRSKYEKKKSALAASKKLKKAKKTKKTVFCVIIFVSCVEKYIQISTPYFTLISFRFFCLCRYEKATKTTTTTLKSVKSLIRMQINKSVVLESKREYIYIQRIEKFR